MDLLVKQYKYWGFWYMLPNYLKSLYQFVPVAYKCAHFIVSSSTLNTAKFLIFDILIGKKEISLPLFLFLITSEVEHIIICLLDKCFLLLWIIYSYPLHILKSRYLSLKKKFILSSCCGSAVTTHLSIHKDAGLIPGLTQWVKYLALPWAVV